MAPGGNKAVVVEKFAGEQFLEHTHLKDLPIPEPGQGEVLLNVYLRPINPTDSLLMKGAYGEVLPPPFTPGSDGVAKVVKNGPNASKFKEGQRVVVVQWPQFEGKGSWAQYQVVPENIVFAVPGSIDDKTAAQFFINPCTAYGMLHESQVPKGEYLLQTAANSVLGKQIISLADHYGIKTINVVRRKDAVDEVKQAGGTEVINLESEDLVKRVQEITGGKGVHAALDPIGAKLTTAIVAALGDSGKYLSYGMLQPGPLEVDRHELMMKGKSVGGFVIYRWIERPDKEKVVKEVFDLLEKKVIKVDLGKSYPLEQFKEAVQEADKSTRRDKKFLEG